MIVGYKQVFATPTTQKLLRVNVPVHMLPTIIRLTTRIKNTKTNTYI